MGFFTYPPIFPINEIVVRADSFEELEDLPPTQGDPPYKGLTYFTEEDKDIYFGREKLSDQLANRLRKTHFLALIEASGSGKSSLLRAGISPRLRARNWQIHVFKPGTHPLTALANSLAQDETSLTAASELRQALLNDPDTLQMAAEKLAARHEAERLLLAVDQFEEIFTQCKDKDEREAFVDNLIQAVKANGAVTILISMRADFYNRVSEFAVLTDLVPQCQ